MPVLYSSLDLNKIRQLRPFKIDYSRVRNLQYVDKDNLLPQTFVDYRRLIELTTFSARKQVRPSFPTDLRYLKNYSAMHFPKGKMLILVNYDLYPSIRTSIHQYIKDVAYEGYYATAYRVRNGTPAELRKFIQGKLPIAGVLMVGNLPSAWFEMDDDFEDSNGNPTHSEFPCDLYFMDLNGTWSDPDNDGKFSLHPTNVAPEIWVGRLWTPNTNGNDAALLKNYFSRNHQYRKGLFGYSNRALAFVDDDWTYFDDCAFDQMFSAANIETITNPATTDGDRYKAEVNQHRAWAQICAHSSPNGHSFKVPGSSSEWVPNTYLRDINPPNAYFYNLFACSNARFTQPDYMAGWYIFDKLGGSVCNGLAAVGSTKTGSMRAFENFYGPMGSGKTIGEAFVDWWKALGAHDRGDRRWYYGMTLLGDPTLNWWSGVVPTLRDPLEGDTFDHYPRLTNFRWDPIGLSGVTYRIEIDAYGARNAGKWAAETGQTWLVSGWMTSNNYEHMFVGAQRGRWRVRARVGSRRGPWSDWRYFTYTV